MLRTTIASGDGAFDDALDAISAAEVGEQTGAVVSFENAEGIRRLENGIVKFRQDGQAKQAFVPYKTIEFDVTVQAPVANHNSELPV